MDKSRVCINQATKLATKKCVKKTNLLVYEKDVDVCAHEPVNLGCHIPPISSIPIKRIRICTGAELKKMCPPKLCSCPPTKETLGFFGFLGRLLGFGCKVAIAGGLVYWTYSVGLWGDSEQTEDIYLAFCETFCPEAASLRNKKHISEVCVAEMDLMCNEPEIPAVGGDPCARAPSTEQTVYKLKERWNSAVVTVFDVVTHFPTYLHTLYEKAKGDPAQIEACKQKKKK